MCHSRVNGNPESYQILLNNLWIPTPRFHDDRFRGNDTASVISFVRGFNLYMFPVISHCCRDEHTDTEIACYSIKRQIN